MLPIPTDLDTLRTLVEEQQVECPYLGPNQGKCRDESIGFICSECHGTGQVPNPAWAAMREVLGKKCPGCSLSPWLSAPRHLDTCKGFVPRNWEGQPKGALAGAVLFALEPIIGNGHTCSVKWLMVQDACYNADDSEVVKTLMVVLR